MNTIYPLFTTGAIGNNLNFLYALIIGIVFGFIIERAGFGSSKQIAPLFYFRSLRVSQIMVSAFLTCAILLTTAVFYGLLAPSLPANFQPNLQVTALS